MPKKGGFFVNDTHRFPKDRERGKGPTERLERVQVMLLHREARAGKIDVDAVLAEIEEKHAIPDDVRRFVHAVIMEGISPHTPKDGRPRHEIIREANVLIDEISFALSVRKYQRGEKGQRTVPLADYYVEREVIDSDFDEA